LFSHCIIIQVSHGKKYCFIESEVSKGKALEPQPKRGEVFFFPTPADNMYFKES